MLGKILIAAVLTFWLPAVGGNLTVTVDTGMALNGGLSSLNFHSRLSVLKIVINDDACPAQLTEAGLWPNNNKVDFLFSTTGKLTSLDSIDAVDITFLAYDYFDRAILRFATPEAFSLSPGKEMDIGKLMGQVVNERQRRLLFKSVTFVSAIRKDGSLWFADESAIIALVKSLNLEFPTQN